jgi:DNA-binding NarL/FixJ family response regulator
MAATPPQPASAFSLATIRTHLERIFEKTGTLRQAELIRVLLQGQNGGGEA